jgi:hypothetical protein
LLIAVRASLSLSHSLTLYIRKEQIFLSVWARLAAERGWWYNDLSMKLVLSFSAVVGRARPDGRPAGGAAAPKVDPEGAVIAAVWTTDEHPFPAADVAAAADDTHAPPRIGPPA